MSFAYDEALSSSITRLNSNFLIKIILILNVVLSDVLNLNLLNKEIKIRNDILKTTKIKKFLKMLKITIKSFFLFFLNFNEILKSTMKLDESHFVFILINVIEKEKTIRAVIKKESIFIFLINYVSTTRG